MCSRTNRYLGMIKFFRNKDYLDMFLDGTLYCNTPEYYRNSTQKGVSDRNESCVSSFYTGRGDRIERFEINGIEIPPPTRIITRQGRKDGWLHCWAIIQLPENDKSFEKLNKDIQQLKEEFGSYYAFINSANIMPFLERIKNNTNCSFFDSEVTYFKGGYIGHSILHKSEEFSYQREYRIILGECESDCVDPKIFSIKKGFHDLVESSPCITLHGELEGSTEKLEFTLK